MHLRADQKLFLSYLAVIAAVVVALTLGVGSMLRRHLTAIVADDLRRELYLARTIEEQNAAMEPDTLADFLGRVSGRRITVIAPDGRVLGDSERDGPGLRAMENHGARPEVREALEGHVGRSVRVSSSVGAEYLYLAVPTSAGLVMRVSVPLREVNRAVARVQRGIFGVGVVALVLTGLLSFGFSRVVTHPLRQIAGVARAMAAGDLTRRARVRHRDELGEMADALDTLASELQKRLGQLEGERAEMQALIDAMAEGVIAVDAQGRVTRTNPAARRMFSLSGDPSGISPQEVARRQGFLDLVNRALAGNPVPPTDLTMNERHLLATAQPLPGGGSVMVFLDVSQLRRLEDVRRDFVANASHELKTPLTVIRGFSETLLDPNLPPELRVQFAETVKTNADRLQRIVDDLLDLSRLESGGWRVEPAIVSVAELAADAWADFRDRAGRKQARFVVDVPPEAEFVWADPSALRQVLSNLYSNSLRYIPEGGTIEVSARPLPPSAAGGTGPTWISIAVRDTGSGIPSAHLPRVFERFYRADAARSREEGGTGLGLAIVKHMVEGHGGTIQAESRLGRGTTIRFTLPAPDEHDNHVEAQAAGEQPQYPPGG
ncbi:MAG TPA: ATP-binding protein [Longimicrobiaceae bacterium]|nr:ATP-binding protein [Longimicrobiaceae bacterium]